jgi:hypothetical protein
MLHTYAAQRIITITGGGAGGVGKGPLEEASVVAELICGKYQRFGPRLEYQ